MKIRVWEKNAHFLLSGLILALVFITGCTFVTGEPLEVSPPHDEVFLPRLESVTDSLGNRQFGSWARSGPFVMDPAVVQVGETVMFSVKAESAADGTLEYRLSVQPPGGSFQVVHDWTSSKTLRWDVTSDFVGINVTANIAVRGEGDVRRLGSADDYTYLFYNVW